MSDVIPGNSSTSKSKSARLTEHDREQLQKNLDTLEEMGEMVGSWYGKGTTTCRRQSVSLTIGFDKEIDPFRGDEFVNMLLIAPTLYGPTIRRLLELDAECEEFDLLPQQ